jgi:ribokinase
MTVLVVGNATVDLSFELDRLPLPGETVIARSRMIDTGGKGLNQAIVANRAGADVIYIAPIGNDPDADLIRAYIEGEGFARANLLCRRGPTDQSIIYLDPRGENTIVSTAGLARSLRADEASDFIDRLGRGDILLMQGNLTRDTTEMCLRRARGRGANTVLNPAPISFDYQGIWDTVDVAVVNEIEARILSGLSELEAAARLLVSWGASAVIATLGPAGALIVEGRTSLEVPAPSVKTIDTAGAGDVFCGVLAAALASGSALKNAVPRAVAAASLSVTRRGTSSAFPTSAELANIAAKQQI